MSSLIDKLKSSRNFLSGLVLSSIISTSAFSAEPFKINPDKNGAWNASPKVEMQEFNLNYKPIGKTQVPLYLSGERNEAEKSIVIIYSTFPTNQEPPREPLQINTLDSRFNILKPEGVSLTVEQGEKYNQRGQIMTSKFKEQQSISIERILFEATETGIGILRQSDPLQGFSDAVDTSGKLGNELGIYGILRKAFAQSDEKNEKKFAEKYAGALELMKLELKANDTGSAYPRVSKIVKLKIVPGSYSGAKIPIIISQRVALGNTSQGSRGENPFSGQLETIAEFEFDNPNVNANRQLTPSPSSGRYVLLISNEMIIPQARTAIKNSYRNRILGIRDSNSPEDNKRKAIAILEEERDKQLTLINFSLIKTKKNLMYKDVTRAGIQMTKEQNGNFKTEELGEKGQMDINSNPAKLIMSEKGVTITANFMKVTDQELIISLMLKAQSDKGNLYEGDLEGIQIPKTNPEKEPDNILAVSECESGQNSISIGTRIFVDGRKRNPASLEELGQYLDQLDGWSGIGKLQCPSGGKYILNKNGNTSECTIPAHQNHIF